MAAGKVDRARLEGAHRVPSSKIPSGHEEEWQTTHARRVEYQDLPTGSYTFEVEAVDRDLVASETPATFALTITLP